jgi:hypothetical protein
MITLTRLSEIVDAYGADPDCWPLEDRMAALDLMARSAEARALADEAAKMDSLLDAVPLMLPPRSTTESLAARIVARIPAADILPLSRIPKVNWGWPNWTALAAAAAAGLIVGWSGLNIGMGYAAGTDLSDPFAPAAALEETLW